MEDRNLNERTAESETHTLSSGVNGKPHTHYHTRTPTVGGGRSGCVNKVQKPPPHEERENIKLNGCHVHTSRRKRVGPSCCTSSRVTLVRVFASSHYRGGCTLGVTHEFRKSTSKTQPFSMRRNTMKAESKNWRVACHRIENGRKTLDFSRFWWFSLSFLRREALFRFFAIFRDFCQFRAVWPQFWARSVTLGVCWVARESFVCPALPGPENLSRWVTCC